MTKRVLAGIFGAVLFAVLVPLAYILAFAMPNNLASLAWLFAGGAALGGLLGAMFPKVFGFFFEAIFGI